MTLDAVVAVWSTVVFHSPLVIASLWIARWLLPHHALAQRCADTLFVACILWRIEAIALGSMQSLHWPAIVLAHALILALVAWFVRGRSQRSAPSPPRVEPTAVARTAGGWLVLVGALAIYRTVFLADPYDSLTYHLMLPVHWLQTGGVGLLGTPFGDISPSYTPESVESVFLALMLPSGHDHLARIGQLPFLLAAAFAVFDLARRANPAAPAWTAAVGASAFLLLPDLLHQGTGSMADVACAAFFLGGSQMLLRYRESPTTGRAALGGALAGMFVASRFPAVLGLPFLVLPWLVTTRSRRRDAVVFLAGVFVTGAYPYLRNWALTGNPVYPLDVTLLGQMHLPGLFSRDAMLNSVFHLEGHRLVEYYTYYLRAGLGWFLVGAVAPILVLRRRMLLPLGLSLAGILLACAQLFLVPFNANGRFLFPAWGWLVTAATVSLSAHRWGRCVLVFVLLGHAWDTFRVLPATWTNGPWIALAVAGVFMLGWNGTWLCSRLHPRLQRGCLVAAVAAWITAIGVAGHLRELRTDAIYASDFRYAPFADGWRTLREVGAGQSVAYVGLNLPYPLVGRSLSNRVTTIPPDGGPAGQLPHEQARRLRRPLRPNSRTVELSLDREAPDPRAWRQALQRDAIDILAIYLRPEREEPVEYRWACKDPGGFEPIETGNPNGQLKLFRVRPRES